MKNEVTFFLEGDSPLNLSPTTMKTNLDFWIVGCIYQGVRMYDETYTLNNRILEKFTIEGNTLFLKIKKIQWHDNSEVTAQDLKRSIEFTFKNRNLNYETYLKKVIGFDEFKKGVTSDISGLRVVNSKILQVDFVEYDDYFNYMLLQPILIPAKPAMGCGPYKLQSIEENKVVLVRNEEFHLGCPPVQTINTYFGDFSELKTRLKNGSIDFTEISYNQLLNINEIDSNLNIYRLPGLKTVSFVLNPTKVFINEKFKDIFFATLNISDLLIKTFKDDEFKSYSFYPKILQNKYSINKEMPKLNYEALSQVDGKVHIRLGFNPRDSLQSKIASIVSYLLSEFFIIELSEIRLPEDKLNCDLYLENFVHAIAPQSNKKIKKILEGWAKFSEEAKEILYYYHEIGNKKTSSNIINLFNKKLVNSKILLPIIEPPHVEIASKFFKNTRPDARGVLWNIHEVSYSN